MEEKEGFQSQFKEIVTSLNDSEFISKASDEELMGYLFMAERVEDKIQKLAEMEEKKDTEEKK